MRALCGLLAALMLTGCSAIRFSYNNGAQLAWWWLDGYVDFSSEQTPAAKQAIERMLAWHRATQLAEYVPVLTNMQAQVLEAATPGQVCAVQDLVREKLEPTLQRVLVEFADLLPGLGAAQFKHLEQRYAKSDDEMRRDFLQPDPATRQRESLKRAVERAENLYGRLDEPQKRVIAAGIAASPFNPEAWLAERQRQNRDIVQTLRRLHAERADRDQRLAALRALAERGERSPDPAYRSYQTRLAEFNCAFAAQIHNSTSPPQRLKARDTLKGWEEDLRALIAGPG